MRAAPPQPRAIAARSRRSIPACGPLRDGLPEGGAPRGGERGAPAAGLSPAALTDADWDRIAGTTISAFQIEQAARLAD